LTLRVNQSLAKTAASVNYPSARPLRLIQIDAPVSSRLSRDNGLKPPAAVTVATEEYLEVEDAFGSWLDECCVQGPNKTATSAELWDSWQRWATKTNEFVGTQRRFAQKLEDRGFERDRNRDEQGKRNRIHRGLGLVM